jgi:S-adenosylmethionine/arginine decarboxylase-like enzyme
VLTASGGGFDNASLPPLLYAEEHRIPKFIYTSKTYQDNGVRFTDNSRLVRPCASFRAEEDVSESVYEPIGQHLLVDIENVDRDFLESEERLAWALVETVKGSGSTLISYNCHGLDTGVHCVGVLVESHIAVHTWPDQGLVIFDLYTCGPRSLMPLLPLAAKLFAVDSTLPSAEKPKMKWTYKKRGFPLEGFWRNEKPSRIPSGWMEFEGSDCICAEESEVQTVGVFDTTQPRFLRFQRNVETELYQPDVVRHRDKTIQYEALVHPAMITHDGPKRVVVVGWTDGATLHEVLKHKTVEKVTFVVPDEALLNMSRTCVAEWNDCGNLVGSARSCFDDERVEIVFADPFVWFVQRFLTKNDIQEGDLYDVAILNSL